MALILITSAYPKDSELADEGYPLANFFVVCVFVLTRLVSPVTSIVAMISQIPLNEASSTSKVADPGLPGAATGTVTDLEPAVMSILLPFGVDPVPPDLTTTI